MITLDDIHEHGRRFNQKHRQLCKAQEELIDMAPKYNFDLSAEPMQQQLAIVDALTTEADALLALLELAYSQLEPTETLKQD